MTYHELTWLHLATVLPAVIIGTYLLLAAKGTTVHRGLGRIYMPLMLTTGIVTLFMPARVGPSVVGHFGLIHVFSLFTLYSVPTAYRAIRTGNVGRHRRAMIGLYVGGILVAGSFAFMPGRMLHELLF